MLSPKKKGRDLKKMAKNKTNIRGDKMTKKLEDYIESDDERSEGHVDTRHNNFECENPDKHLGCDPGIDVAG